MIKIFQPLLSHALIYIDDIFSGSHDDHHRLLNQFYDIVQSHGIMLSAYYWLNVIFQNQSKCKLKLWVNRFKVSSYLFVSRTSILSQNTIGLRISFNFKDSNIFNLCHTWFFYHQIRVIKIFMPIISHLLVMINLICIHSVND